MRYFAIIAIAIIEMVLASCSIKEEQVILEKPTSIKLAFEATNEGEPSTKTAVQSNGTSVWWSAHEDINIFFGDSESSRFTSTNDEPVAKAQFTGSISAITGEVDGSEANYFWGVYPYNALNTCDGTSITATLSGEQTASAGTFTDNQWMTIARSQGLALSFRAVCAGFRFSVTKSGVKSVTFRGNNNEVLAGKARIGMDANGLPIVLENLTEVKEITLSAPNDETLEVGTMYYMTFYPTNFTDGFTVTFNTETETASRVYSTAKNFARTQVHIGTNFDNSIGYHSKVQHNNEIWYTTTNGNTISVPDNVDFGASLVANSYFTNFGILAFDDDVTKIPNGVFNEVLVSSVILPESTQEIEDYAFQHSSITSIRIPNAVVSLGNGVFAYCPYLSSFEGQYSSQDGKMLIKTDTYNHTTLLAFADPGATSINISQSGINVDNVGSYVFAGHQNLNNLYCTKEVSYNSFYDCNALQSITLSSSAAQQFLSMEWYDSIPNVEYLTVLEPEDPYSTVFIYGLGWPRKLKSITLPANTRFAEGYGPISSNPPRGCQIYGSNASVDHTCWIVNGSLQLFAFPYDTHFYRLTCKVPGMTTQRFDRLYT